MDDVFDIVRVRQGDKFVDVLASFFSHFVCWGLSPIYNWSDGGVFFMDFYKASGCW